MDILSGLILLSIITCFVGILYAGIISSTIKAWHGIPDVQLPEQFSPTAYISIIIAARNEAANIEACLNSIINLSYPSDCFEVIVVDDHSEDQTAAIVNQYPAANIRLLALANHIKPEEPIIAYKKKAIEIGIKHAQGDIIACTDADCIVPEYWLHNIAYGYERRGAVLIAGPVLFHQEKNHFERFQSLDFAGMMLLTATGLYSKRWPMANGANLAYAKSIFQTVGGFSDNTQLASGDDVFMVKKVLQLHPGNILFIKNKSAVVYTAAKPTWTSFLNQRIRWSTKNRRNPDLWVSIALGVVFFASILAVACFAGSCFFSFYFVPALLALLLLKGISDFMLLREATAFFERKELLRGFWISELFHILYISVVGTASLFINKYSWKGRKVQ